MSTAYTRALFAQGEGFPLFNPRPFDDLPEPARRIGIEIGDIGIITPDGSFDPIFNILRPADDYANRFGVPARFEQITLHTNDISIRERFHPPGTVISNNRVNKRNLNVHGDLETNPLFPIGNEAKIEISTTSKETGVLILPHGASRCDVRSLQALRDYALAHAQNWYAFVNGKLQRMLGNNELYLVTGVTKSTSWCIASANASSGGGEVSLELKEAQFSGETTCEWKTNSAAMHSGPYRRPGEESWRDNQTVFLRGFKVAIRPRSLLGTRVDFSEEEDDFSEEEDCGPNIFHPSDAINEYLLNSVPDAVVAVTHDDEWTSVLEKSDGEFPKDEELVKRISNKFHIDTSSGGACLQALRTDGGLYLEPAMGTALQTASRVGEIRPLLEYGADVETHDVGVKRAELLDTLEQWLLPTSPSNGIL